MFISIKLNTISGATSDRDLVVNVFVNDQHVFCNLCSSFVGRYTADTNMISLFDCRLVRVEPCTILDQCGEKVSDDHTHQTNVMMVEKCGVHNNTPVRYYNVRRGHISTIPCPYSMLINTKACIQEVQREFQTENVLNDNWQNTAANVEVETSQNTTMDLLFKAFHDALKDEPCSSTGFYSQQSIRAAWTRARKNIFPDLVFPCHIDMMPPERFIENVNVSPPLLNPIQQNHTYATRHTCTSNEIVSFSFSFFICILFIFFYLLTHCYIFVHF